MLQNDVVVCRLSECQKGDLFSPFEKDGFFKDHRHFFVLLVDPNKAKKRLLKCIDLNEKCEVDFWKWCFVEKEVLNHA